eukprot:CAMPEP_0119403316 /NCGR_PEP_ID=MMETSP1334-20130426/143323_1 /TAXON_ID=127549 /ORGANISM="Calcidiscus leptoporus, Strain RCC1130" /LENGTH=346 /DNA_ID=CAMNT_0007427261 /DNA_START=833 /DNA_END=1873 /DNA_ORIENTATION=+
MRWLIWQAFKTRSEIMLRFSLIVSLALTFKSASAQLCTCPWGYDWSGGTGPGAWGSKGGKAHSETGDICAANGVGGYPCGIINYGYGDLSVHGGPIKDINDIDCCCAVGANADGSSVAPGAPGDNPTFTKCAEAGPSVTGDPKTRYGDNEIQFHLLEPNLTPVFEQAPFVVLWRAGNPLIDTGNSGDWVLEMEVRALNGVPFEPVNIAVVNPAELLKDELRAVPIPASTLTTMRVSVGGEPLLAGVHTFPSLKLKAAAAPNLKPIGNGYAEVVDLRFASGLHLQVKTAAAVKFESPVMQVKALHLDIDFLSFNRTAARGPLPEIWGLRPISGETKKMLSAPTAGLA